MSILAVSPGRLLLAAVALAALAVAPTASAGLERGSTGPAVERLSQRLAGLGYLPPPDVGLRFTHKTRYAVMAFQKYARIAVDGVVGPETRAALRWARRPVAPRGAGRRVAVSLGRQLAFLVDRENRVRRAISVSTGRAAFRTPRGTFRVYLRTRRSWSYLYGVWLPWVAYYDRGFALHGSRSVPARRASHGCVRVPLPFARRVYGFATKGTKVVVR